VLRSDKERTPSQLELHVVGARAEAMMPRPIWEELVDAHSDTTFDVKLIGDHVVRYPRKKRMLANESPSNLQLQNYAGFYHQIVAGTDGLHSSPDAFVLFNPGIGHPKLQASWRPTMDIILKSGKPALLTSFSQRDQERDVDALHGMADAFDLDFVVAPTENPFSSRCFQLDPSNVFAPIRTNSYVLVVRGQPKPFSV
jgi:mitochondrial splicing suppressor protein 51